MKKHGRHNRRGGSRTMMGVFLILLGLLFLLVTLAPGVNWGNAWPFFVILPGLMFFLGMFTGGRRASGLAIPASLVTGTGLILLYQSLSGDWASWTYIWALYTVFLGVGMIMAGIWGRDRGLRRVGGGF